MRALWVLSFLKCYTLRYVALRVRRETPGTPRLSLVGGHSRGGTPGSIPNPEVKPSRADGTVGLADGRAGRRRPAMGTEHKGSLGYMPGLPFVLAQACFYELLGAVKKEKGNARTSNSLDYVQKLVR